MGSNRLLEGNDIARKCPKAKLAADTASLVLIFAKPTAKEGVTNV
jgi:hypothetical protein